MRSGWRLAVADLGFSLFLVPRAHSGLSPVRACISARSYHRLPRAVVGAGDVVQQPRLSILSRACVNLIEQAAP